MVIHMFLIVALQVFAALSTNFERVWFIFIMTQIRCINSCLNTSGIIEKLYVIKPSARYSRESYTDRNQQIRILHGSV